MSWSGPAAGAASYQQSSYGNGFPSQAPYGIQQSLQYGQQPGFQYQNSAAYPPSGVAPQPSKPMPPKKKGNPIITRYPPPPGYRGPAQPQGPFGTAQYQTPQQSYPQAQSTSGTYPNQSQQPPFPNQGYPAQGYPPTQSYQPQQPYARTGYTATNKYQWPQQPPQGYSSQPSVAQPIHQLNTQSYTPQQAGHPQFPPPINTNPQTWSNAQGWQQTPVSATFPPTSQHSSFSASSANGQPTSDLNPYPTPSSANPTKAQPNPVSAQPQSVTTEATSDEKPPLFLGWDGWDFDFDGAIWPKANEPVDPNLSLGVITWRPAKQVTRALPATFEEAEEQSLKPPAEKLGNGESVSLYFTAENSYEAFLDVRKTDDWDKIKNDPAFVVFTDEDMDSRLISIEDCLALRDRPDELVDEAEERQDTDMPDSTWNVMDNLEQALSGEMEDIKHPTPPRPEETYTRDQAQEDILARLGVTGSPKPPSREAFPVPAPRNDPLPASLPPKPPAPPSSNISARPEIASQRAQSYSSHGHSSFGSGPRPFGSMSSPTSYQSPPVPYTGDQSHHGSAHIPTSLRKDSYSGRKRSYGDTEQEDEHARQPDDHSKRKRRSQIDAAYSRR